MLLTRVVNLPQPIRSTTEIWLACVASISSRVIVRKLEQEQKQWKGEGKGEEETLAHKPHDFEKLGSPTNAAFDWCGAGSVDYLALEISIKPGMFCLRASHIYINFKKLY